MRTNSSEETHQLGKAFGQSLKNGDVVAFFGDLGAGKTTFIRGLVEGTGCSETRSVCSPTFSYLNIYSGKQMIYHFDLYRLPREEEFVAAGFDEYLHANGICCIEWAEKIPAFLPKRAIRITFEHLDEDIRQIVIERPM